MHLLNYQVFYFIDEFNQNHILKINKNINLIFRNYKKSYNLTFLRKLKNFCHSNGFNIFLSNNIKLAKTVGFDGAYIPSFNKHFTKNISFKKNFKLLGSAHNLREIREKEKQGVHYIFLSPIFKKDNKKVLGLYKFLKLKSYTNKRIVALGGINTLNVKKLNLINNKSFASINFIKNLYE